MNRIRALRILGIYFNANDEQITENFKRLLKLSEKLNNKKMLQNICIAYKSLVNNQDIQNMSDEDLYNFMINGVRDEKIIKSRTIYYHGKKATQITETINGVSYVYIQN